MQLKNNQTNFNEILNLIKSSKQKAYAQINSTMMDLYWDIGKYLSQKVESQKWGRGVVKELANYIKDKDLTAKGFNDRNLWRMKQFYETYKDNSKLSTLWTQLSWSNNRTIFSRCKQPKEREFYLNFSLKERWTNRELERQINSSLFERVMLSDKKLLLQIMKLN